MENFRPYAGKFAEVLGSLAEKAGGEANPLLVPRAVVRNIHVVVCTSDRGLCGGFNVNLTERTRRFIEEKAGDGVSFSFTSFGKKGRDWCSKEGLEIVSEHLGVIGTNISFNIAATVGRSLVEEFLKGGYDEVWMVYPQFVSMAKQTPVVKQLLPIPPIVSEEESEDDKVYLAEHICEPSPEELLEDMLPRNVYVQLYSALLETSTSEHAARMVAMDNATKACNDMIDNLTLVFNKARQAAITAELMDIVGGAEALKG